MIAANRALLKEGAQNYSLYNFCHSLRRRSEVQRSNLIKFLLFFYLPAGSLLRGKKSVKQKINLVWPYAACAGMVLIFSHSLSNAPVNGMPHYPYLGTTWGKVGICTFQL